MKIRHYLACTCGLRSMFETTTPPKCWQKLSCCRADQKQVKIKNLYIFFWWWCHYFHVLPFPLCHFLSHFSIKLEFCSTTLPKDDFTMAILPVRFPKLLKTAQKACFYSNCYLKCIDLKLAAFVFGCCENLKLLFQ